MALLLSGQPLPTGAGAPGPGPAGPTPGSHSPAGPQGLARIRARQDDPPEPPRPDTVVAGNWTNLFPDLYAVSALADGEIWAAGEYGHVLHYTGSAWVAADPANLRGIDLWDIKMLTAEDGWIPAGARAFEYTGSDWVERSTGLDPAPGLQVGLVAPLGNADVWGIGHQADHDTMLHWDGSRWAAIGPALPSSIFLYDIAMISDDEGWVVGDESQNGSYIPIVFHYNGTSWTRLAGPPLACSLFSIWASRPGDAWMVGAAGAGGQIYHSFIGMGSPGARPLARQARTCTPCRCSRRPTAMPWAAISPRA